MKVQQIRPWAETTGYLFGWQRTLFMTQFFLNNFHVEIHANSEDVFSLFFVILLVHRAREYDYSNAQSKIVSLENTKRSIRRTRIRTCSYVKLFKRVNVLLIQNNLNTTWFVAVKHNYFNLKTLTVLSTQRCRMKFMQDKVIGKSLFMYWTIRLNRKKMFSKTIKYTTNLWKNH